MQMSSSYENFYTTLTIKKNVNVSEKVGLIDTSMNISKFDRQHLEENTLKDFFILNFEGVCIIHIQYTDYVADYEKFLLLLQKSVHSLKLLIIPQALHFSYHKIFLKDLQILFLFKSGLICIGVFNKTADRNLSKLMIIHMYIAMINFKGSSLDKIKDVAMSSQDKLCLMDYNSMDNYEYKIYEVCFAKFLPSHFEKLFEFIIKKEEIMMLPIKFKNMYLIDLSTDEILFDMLSSRKSRKNLKIHHNTLLWLEILHHSKALMKDYCTLYGMNFVDADTSSKFVKFECTSTYPRLTFLITFVPILRGISIIHVYSQKKLSRITENNEHPKKCYHEFDVIYGRDVNSENQTTEFRYTEPQKLQEIHRFFIEFFVSIRSSSNLFHERDISRELKYFNYTFLREIQGIYRKFEKTKNQNTGMNMVDNILNAIFCKLHELYMNTKNGAWKIMTEWRNENKDAEGHSISIDKEKILNSLFKEYDMKKETLCDNNNELIIRKTNFGEGQLEKIEKTLSLSKYEEFNHPGDTSIPLSKNVSIIESNHDERSEVYLNQVVPSQEAYPELQTIDNLLNDFYMNIDTNSPRQNQAKPINVFEALSRKGTGKPMIDTVSDESCHFGSIMNTPSHDIAFSSNIKSQPCLKRHKTKDEKDYLPLNQRIHQMKTRGGKIGPNRLIMFDEDNQMAKGKENENEKGVDKHSHFVGTKMAIIPANMKETKNQLFKLQKEEQNQESYIKKLTVVDSIRNLNLHDSQSSRKESDDEEEKNGQISPKFK